MLEQSYRIMEYKQN